MIMKIMKYSDSRTFKGLFTSNSKTFKALLIYCVFKDCFPGPGKVTIFKDFQGRVSTTAVQIDAISYKNFHFSTAF